MGCSMHFLPSLGVYTVPRPVALCRILGWKDRCLGFVHASARVCVCVRNRTHAGGAVKKTPIQDSRLSSGPPTDKLGSASSSPNQGHLSLPHLFQGLSSRTKWMETTQKTETGSKNEQAQKELSTHDGRVGREQVLERPLMVDHQS